MKIFPRNDLYGEFTVPTDKSITHKAIMLGALAKGKTKIINPLACSDTQTLLACVKKFGAKVWVKKHSIEIKSPKKPDFSQKFDCGNSTATLRFLCGAAAGYGGRTVLTGSKQLCKKPMRGLKEPLEKTGATVALTNYYSAPVLIESDGVRAVDYSVEVGSSQIKSAMLACAMLGGVKAEIHEQYPSRNHLEILMREMGANLTFKDGGRNVFYGGGELTGKTIAVCRDFTLAAHYLALGLILGKVVCRNVNINPTRTAFLDVAHRMGANISVEEKKLVSGERTADIIAYKSKLKATHVSADEACSLGDELPLVATLMGLADGESIISLNTVKNKEVCGDGEEISNMYGCVNALADAMNAVGGSVRKFDGGVVITGVDRYSGGTLKTGGYPLVALCGAIALTSSTSGGDVADDCDLDGYKAFFDELFKNSFAVVKRRNGDFAVNDLYSYALTKAGLESNSCTTVIPSEDNFRKLMGELKNYDGYAVFEPYVHDVTRRLYTLKRTAKIVKSANIVSQGVGYSTDGKAVVDALKYYGVALQGKRVLVVGCGGLGRSVAFAATEEKADVDVYDKNSKSALDFKKRVKGNVCVLARLNSTSCYDVVIETEWREFDSDDERIREFFATAKCKVFVDLFALKNSASTTVAAKEYGVKVVKGSAFTFLQAYYGACAYVGKDLSEKRAFATYERYKKENRDD